MRRRNQRRGRAAFSEACSAAAARRVRRRNSRLPTPIPGAAAASSRPGYAPQQQQGGPWGAPQPQQAGPAAGPWGAPQPQQGGGFLKGALGAAAGVAGGMLLADSFKGLFGGGQANAAGLGGGLGGAGLGGGGPAAAARGSSIITMRRRSPRTTRLTIMTMIPATTMTRQTMIHGMAATITATISDRSTKQPCAGRASAQPATALSKIRNQARSQDCLRRRRTTTSIRSISMPSGSSGNRL